MENTTPSRLCPWILWAATTATMTLVAFAGPVIAEAARAHYQLYRMSMLPMLTNVALQVAGMLWVGVVVSSALGVWQIRGHSERALPWAVCTILFFLALAAVVAAGLALPFNHIQGHLGK